METLSFTLGVLSVVIVAFVAVLVWGVVKVVKQQKQIKHLQQNMEEGSQHLWRRREEDQRYHNDQINDLHRGLDRRFEDIERDINEKTQNSFSMSKSYIDMRIDKMLEKTSKKQLIKG